jgi:hypothetical protein
MGRVVSYCVQDCFVTRALDDELNLSATKLSFVIRCQVPLSQALHATTAQNLGSLIQSEFRRRGYSIPYNISK